MINTVVVQLSLRSMHCFKGDTIKNIILEKHTHFNMIYFNDKHIFKRVVRMYT